MVYRDTDMRPTYARVFALDDRLVEIRNTLDSWIDSDAEGVGVGGQRSPRAKAIARLNAERKAVEAERSGLVVELMKRDRILREAIRAPLYWSEVTVELKEDCPAGDLIIDGVYDWCVEHHEDAEDPWPKELGDEIAELEAMMDDALKAIRSGGEVKRQWHAALYRRESCIMRAHLASHGQLVGRTQLMLRELVERIDRQGFGHVVRAAMVRLRRSVHWYMY